VVFNEENEQEGKNMWKSPKVVIGFGIVILALVFLLDQGHLWSGVSSSSLNARSDQSSGEGGGPGKVGENAGSRNCCCNGSGVEDKVSVSENDRVKRLVYEEYAKKLNDTAITVEVNDLGCHMEVSVLKDGKTLKQLSVSEGVIQEID
jgi:hypothetical protein